MIYLKTYKVHELPPSLYKWCHKNNFYLNRSADGYDSGCMRDDLVAIRKRDRLENKETRIVIAHNGFNKMGWSLLDGSYLQMYVLSSYRRRGVGSRLLKKAVDLNLTKRALVVEPHDSRSKGFYKKNGLRGRRISEKCLYNSMKKG